MYRSPVQIINILGPNQSWNYEDAKDITRSTKAKKHTD